VAKLSTEKSRSIPAEWGKPGGPFPASSLSDNEWISIADVTGFTRAPQKFDKPSMMPLANIAGERLMTKIVVPQLRHAISFANSASARLT